MVDDNQTFNCVIQVHSATGPEQEIIRRVKILGIWNRLQIKHTFIVMHFINIVIYNDKTIYILLRIASMIVSFVVPYMY